jgi:hypothetical protein
MNGPSMRSAWFSAAAGVLTIAAVVAYERHALGLLWRREGVPQWGTNDIVSTAGYMVGSALLAFALVRWGMAHARMTATPPSIWRVGTPGERVWISAITAVAVLAAVLIAFAPAHFHGLAREDFIVENASALMALMAALWAWVLAWKLYRQRLGTRLEIAAVAAFGTVCFLIAGEEVSWFQRVFDFRPAWIERNWQKETNLHNFSTDAFENAYFFLAGFVALVLLPTARALRMLDGRLAPLSRLCPRESLIGVGTLISAFNYDMVMGAPTQIAFWGSIGVLAALAWHCTDRRGRFIALAWLAVAVGLQACFLAFGHQSSRRWDVTEYKELLIPAALFVWSMQMWELRTAPTR